MPPPSPPLLRLIVANATTKAKKPSKPSKSSKSLPRSGTASNSNNNNNNNSTPCSLQVSCHVKPNASRDGIVAVGPSAVDVCVSAAPRDGESNAAVERVFGEAFSVPKFDVGIIRGGKSRDKTVSISGLRADIGDGDREAKVLARMKEVLERAMLGSDGKKR